MTFPYEEAAHQVTVTGWSCKSCGRFYGADGERSARYCCAKDMACECGKRMGKSWTKCDDCRHLMDVERFMKLEPREWDGGDTPLYSDAADKYFFDVESLQEYVAETNELDDDAPFTVEMFDDLRLRLCRPVSPRPFEVGDLFCDCLGEDQESPYDAEIKDLEQKVNVWVDKQPKSWESDKYAVAIASYPLER